MTSVAIVLAAVLLEHGITKAIDRLAAAVERAITAAQGDFS